MRRALIFGITGQDGSYLAEHLLNQNYQVFGFIRRSATGNTKNIEHILEKITLVKGDLADVTSLYRAISEVKPHEIYNEADQDHVGWSYDTIGYSCDITGKAVGDILEVIRQVCPKARYFQPLTSHMFGKTDTLSQNESSCFNPQSPYAAAKILAYNLVKFYRQVYGLHASCAFFYNHTSPRKNEDYALNKIVRSAYRISCGKQKSLSLGDISSRVDYGYAPEYMRAAVKILNLDRPDDFIIASGTTVTLEEILKKTFKKLDLNYRDFVVHNTKWERPGHNGLLCGDIKKAQKAFGFSPKYSIDDLIDILLEDAKTST